MTDPRKLDERIDSALAAWPPAEPESAAPPGGDASWDATAGRTMERIAGGGARFSGFHGGATMSDDDLFAAPLPEEGGEEVTLTAPGRAHARDAAPRPGGPVSRPSNRAEKISVGGQKSTRGDVPSGRMEAISPPSSREARMTMSSEQRQRERTSFKDIAKLAETPPPSAAQPASSGWGVADQGPPSSKINPNDSGMVDLKLIAALDPNAAQRAQSTPLAAAGLFEDEPPPVSGQARTSAPPVAGRASAPPSGVAAFAPSLPNLPEPPPVSSHGAGFVSQPASQQMVAEAVPAASVSPLSTHGASVAPQVSAQAMLAAPKPAKKRAEKKGGVVVALFGVVALAAAAAGGVVYVKHHKAAATLAAATPAPQPPAPVAANPVTPPTTDTAPMVPAAGAADDQATASDDLALDDTKPTTPGKPAAKGRRHAGGGAKVAAKEPDAPAPAAADAPKNEPKVKFAPSGGGGDLDKAMRQAAGPIDGPAQADDKPTGPQFAPGSVPQKPANGAVQGAIGAVLPNARACLGPDDPVSRATLVFGSTGAVQSVSISGGAAGKPEEKCIKQALGRAKVQPFAEPTFTTSFTVRP